MTTTDPTIPKYELLYREQENVCGEPFAEYIKFANSYAKAGAAVLDLGCGQGRDALVFASKGHKVTGVDISATGIQQMQQHAAAQNLTIEGIVADLVEFEFEASYDLIILDRTLHMLPSMHTRLDIIISCANHLHSNGHILIADERPNIKAFVDWFAQDDRDWVIADKMKPSFCFAQLRD